MNWKALKLFDQLFNDGETSIELLNFPLGKRVYEMEYIKLLNKKVIIKTELYDAFYLDIFQKKINGFKSLIEKFNLYDTNFLESELEALLKIHSDKEYILETFKSQKEIATYYLGSAKYVKKGSIFYNAILKILDVAELPVDEHDQQFLYILHCKNKTPKKIILCENDNQLRKPRLNDVELWYAGGRNTAKLKFIVEPEIPIYYLCDWDNKGIQIYQDIKKNIFPSIETLIPQEPIKFKDIKSEWKAYIDYSLFSGEAKQLLVKLIPYLWIEEESINHDFLKR